MSAEEDGLANAHRIAREIVADLGARYADNRPHEITVAMAIALGTMVAATNALGGFKPGRGGHALRRLFDMAELTAERCLES